MDRHRTQHLAHAGRAAMVMLLLAALATTAWPSCDSSDGSGAASDFDPGPTFGAEIAVTVVGRGRVTGTPGSLDCPGDCFARALIADPSVDGAPASTLLVAEATSGAHFEKWKLDIVDLGVRARGPAQCSPMMRKTSTPSFDPAASVLSVRFGETTGTPPAGHAAECAAFTKVPVAYAVTAVFAEDHIEPIPDASTSDATIDEILFEPPAVATGPAREIGISSGMIYWRFEESGTGQSGIAAGVSGGAADVVVDPSAFITKFDVDVHVAFQQGGLTKAIQGGTETVYTMGGTSSCAALASDSTNIYCRSPADGGSRLLQWPLATGLAPNTIHLLPFGNDLAVDESAQKVYFSDDPGSMNGTAVVKSAPRSGDGGAPLASSLAGGQYGPRDLVVGSSYLFWVDNHGGTYQTAAVSKSGAGSVQLGTSGPFVRFVVPDPDLLNSYWVGLSQFQVGQSTILKAFANTITTTIFRSSLDSLNGLAVDGNFVYWTQNDGRVYRALKTPSPPPKL